MPTEALDLDTNVYADWCIELLSNNNTTKPSQGTLRYFQNVAEYFACVGVKRHKTMSKQEKMSAAARSYEDFAAEAFLRWLGEKYPGNHSFALTRATSSLKNTYGMRKRRLKSLAALEA